MATQAKLDKDARRRRRDQRAGSSRTTMQIRECGNCYAYAVNYCAFYQSSTRASNRPREIGCREHRFESEV